MDTEQNQAPKPTAQHETAIAYNTQPAGLEKWMDTTFNKQSPVQLPAGVKKWFGNNLWWLAIVGGVLSLLGALSVWNAANMANTVLDAYGDLATPYRQQIGSAVYVSMATSVVGAALLLLAQGKLKEHRKEGWNLLFYNFLLSLVLSVVSVVMSGSYALVGGIVGLAIGFVIGGWLLFQFRSQFSR
ncbi:MAG: hypothetical protein WBB39_03445 [Candidatus Saccharimonadales bacterium]